MPSLKTKDKLTIVVSGGSGRFGSVFKKAKSIHKFYFPSKNKLNILKPKNIENYLKKIKPDVFIHLAGLSRPMEIHETNFERVYSLILLDCKHYLCLFKIKY